MRVILTGRSFQRWSLTGCLFAGCSSRWVFVWVLGAFEMVGVPFDGRISGFGSVSGVFFGSWRTNVLVACRKGGLRLPKPVKAPPRVSKLAERDDNPQITPIPEHLFSMH